jgi:hypothetical protein
MVHRLLHLQKPPSGRRLTAAYRVPHVSAISNLIDFDAGELFITEQIQRVGHELLRRKVETEILNPSNGKPRRPAVNRLLTVAADFTPAASGGKAPVPHPQSGGFDTGAAVRLPAIGRPSQVGRISPMEPPRGVPVSNPPRLRDFAGFVRPLICLSRQPAGSEASRA